MDLPRAKATLFDPGIETLLFVCWPERFERRGRVPELISNVDILPTVLEAVGRELPDNLHGRSFLALLENRPYEERDVVYAEKTFHDAYDPMRCVRAKTHKYIRYFEKSTLHRVAGGAIAQGTNFELGRMSRPEIEALYDLRKDPNETENLADDPAHEAMRDDLRKRLYQWMARSNDPLLNGPVPSPDYTRHMHEFIAAGEDPPEQED